MNLIRNRISQLCMLKRNMSNSSKYIHDSLQITKPSEFVYHVEISRPDYNAMNLQLWKDMVTCFNNLNEDEDCRCVVISGSGKLFTSGIDLNDFSQVMAEVMPLEPGRKSFALGKIIRSLQESFTVIEKCTKPVIAAVHGACIGAGVDLICSCDIRYCSQDAWFQVKEVDLGLAADVGTLQRLPKIIGSDSLVREMCYTARPITSDEAKSAGLVSRVFEDKSKLMDGALRTASLIASKSPIAVQGTKLSLVHSRDHPVSESLNHIALLNQSLLQSEDLIKAVEAAMNKKTPKFSKL